MPLQPIEVRARTMRPGKKVQLVEASLLAGETEVVRATGLRIRVADSSSPTRPTTGSRRGRATLPRAVRARRPVNFGVAMEMTWRAARSVCPGRRRCGSGSRVPVVAGEETTPLMRVAAAADFGNGISGVVDWDEHLFINPDLTIYLHRQPAGEWVGLDARTWPTHEGVGIAEAALYDEGGRIGRSVQSLLLDRR